MSYPDICVSGAGLEPVNGTYIYHEMYEGKPTYRLDNDDPYITVSLIFLYGRWSIVFDTPAGQDVPYTSDDDVETPDLCTSWVWQEYSMFGSPPAPTVKICGEEEEHFRRIHLSGGMQELTGGFL